MQMEVQKRLHEQLEVQCVFLLLQFVALDQRLTASLQTFATEGPERVNGRKVCYIYRLQVIPFELRNKLNINSWIQVQRNLQLRIEAQGKYLQQIFEEQQKLNALNSTPMASDTGEAGAPGFKPPLAEMVDKVEIKVPPDVTIEAPGPSGSLVPTEASGLNSQTPQSECAKSQYEGAITFTHLSVPGGLPIQRVTIKTQLEDLVGESLEGQESSETAEAAIQFCLLVQGHGHGGGSLQPNYSGLPQDPSFSSPQAEGSHHQNAESVELLQGQPSKILHCTKQ